MTIETIVLGDLKTNCYIINKNNHVLIIDPACEYEKILKAIKGKIIDGVLITHNHFDHIGAKDCFDKKLIYDFNNLDEKEYNIGNFNFEVIYTPGHRFDCITIYFKNEKIMFTGDFIFKGTVGRTDLFGGNTDDMKKSINKIIKYDKSIIIYPGHGDKTILGLEIYNLNNSLFF